MSAVGTGWARISAPHTTEIPGDVAFYPAEFYPSGEELEAMTPEQYERYHSFAMDRSKRYSMKLVSALEERGRKRSAVLVDGLDLAMDRMMEIVYACRSLRSITDVDVMAEAVALPVHGHVVSPVVAEPEPGRSDAPAMTVQEEGGSPVAARAGACRCAAPAESSQEAKL